MIERLPGACAPTMSSREIADLTGKRHDHVMRDIENTLQALEIDAPRFGAIYRDARNRKQKEYRLPKRETLILTAGYDIHLRAKIIDRWEELENGQRILASDPIIAMRMAQIEMEQRVARSEERLDAVEQVMSPNGWVTIRGYARRLGLGIDAKQANAVGRIAATMMRDMGEEPLKVPDINHGQINAYPEEVIEAALAEHHARQEAA